MSNIPHVLSSGLPQPHLVHGCWDELSTEPKWFAAFTLSKHEKRVQTHFERQHITSFLPLYKTTHRWKNRCSVRLELPLFPGYLFVRIDPRQRLRVLSTQGVVSLVSSGRELLPIPEADINALRDAVAANKILPHPGIAVGETVRIVAGPMAGAEGVLERSKNELRVVVRLEMLARSVSVEIGTAEIEPIRKHRSHVPSA